MRFLPTSSLDIIEPLAPFVPATCWNKLRNEARDSTSPRNSSEREPVYRDAFEQASAMNQYHQAWDYGQSNASRSKDPFQVRLELEQPILSATQVDSCFAKNDLEFLKPLARQNRSYELKADDDLESYDLELGLLESVQEIAISLYREPARRVQQDVR